MKIYLDYNATTPVAPEVFNAMLPYLKEKFGNPSSGYTYGLEAKQAVENARSQIASLIGSTPGEIYFTSGGSESNNWALKGSFFKEDRKAHIIISAVEHPSIKNPALFLKRYGADVTVIPVDETGMVQIKEIKKAIRPDTILVSIMHSNNEVGTIQPIKEISKITKEAGVLLHTDAAQSTGKVPIDIKDLGVDLLSIAGHKLYAPKGIGALFISKDVFIEPLIHGASQESGLRAGTENVALAIALGEAARIAQENLEEDTKRIKTLRDKLWEILSSNIEGVYLNGHPEKRLPNTLNVSFEGHVGAEILEQLPWLCASTGSACHDPKKASDVLLAMGLDIKRASGAIRFSLGRYTTIEDVEKVGRAIISLLKKE